MELAEENESLFHRTKRIIVDEVDKIFLPLRKRAPRKKMISRAIHPRAGCMLVEKLAKISKVCTSCTSDLFIDSLNRVKIEATKLGVTVRVSSSC